MAQALKIAPNSLEAGKVVEVDLIAFQRRMAGRIKAEGEPKVGKIAGVDCRIEGNKGIACACLFSFPELEEIEVSKAKAKVLFPYAPGFLCFREGHLMIKAVLMLKERPDLLLIDGNGILHPRRYGLACHVGLMLNIPCIGVAKSLLFGELERELKRRGEWCYVREGGEGIGIAYKSSDGKPIYISVGHLISLDHAFEIVKICCRNRLPEPIERAHAYLRERISF